MIVGVNAAGTRLNLRVSCSKHIGQNWTPLQTVEGRRRQLGSINTRARHSDYTFLFSSLETTNFFCKVGIKFVLEHMMQEWAVNDISRPVVFAS